MVIGVPKEIEPDENRVALTPSGASAFVHHGHKVFVERGAGKASGIADAAYRDAGASVVASSKELWERADLVMKVKAPLGKELKWMRAGQIIYAYLHLASNKPLVHELLRKKVTAIAYETIQLHDGALPLLFPMSEVAGRLAVQKGAQCLEASSGGCGVLLSGVSGVKSANVVIIGAGIVGANACYVAVGMGCHVSILDINPARLRYINDVMGGNITTVMANPANIGEEVIQADVVICAVLVPGARTPLLIPRGLVRQMRSGSVIIDVDVDQGGCVETARPTTHHDAHYSVHNVVHYCVPNMPGAVPRTSTYALTNVTLNYGLAMADKGLEASLQRDPALRKGLNTWQGHVTCRAVADSVGRAYHEVTF